MSKRIQSRPKIDFDNLLSKGATTYDSVVGDWWQSRSLDAAHRKAYRHIAKATRNFCEAISLHPKRALDYACGGGAFLAELRQTFPQILLVGLDGSQQLLQSCAQQHGDSCELCLPSQAFEKKGGPLRLVRTSLPNFRLPKARCDLVFLVFPNLVPDAKHLAEFNRNGYGNLRDNAVARMLARFREMDPEEETITTSPDELFDELMTARVFSRNLRRLVRPGGLLARVEYSQAPREQLTELTQWRNLFSEGALESPIKGQKCEAIFRLLGADYRTSKVILDVYHQTGDPDDRRGGYMISFFQAI
ncbi:MAG TPA: class I SAM-dependent methyltransferase [Fibrobacteraceae bacterium]|nr:class I SAM-dependent methyltransferase [Fibrobacteraceae bacterium]